MQNPRTKILKGLKGASERHRQTVWVVSEAIDAERRAFKELEAFKVEVGEMLKRYRESFGLSVKDVAGRTRWSKSYISYMENGERWSADVLADVLHVYTKLDRERGEVSDDGVS